MYEMELIQKGIILSAWININSDNLGNFTF